MGVASAVRRLDPGERATDQVEDLYRAHIPVAVRLAYVLTRDHAAAEDVAHEAFLSAASRMSGMREPERFAAYLRTSVVRRVLMDKRSQGREEARVLRLVEPRNHSHDHAPATELRADLMEALRTLPIRQQAAIVLSYWGDLPEAEIAEALGCRPGTVKSTLSRALANLRKVIGDE